MSSTTAAAGDADRVPGQLDLFADSDEPVCRDPRCLHEQDIHYPASAMTKGCRVFTCPCRGWAA